MRALGKRQLLKSMTGYLLVCTLVVTGAATTLVAGESWAKAQHQELIVGKLHLEPAFPPVSFKSPETVPHATTPELSGVIQFSNTTIRRIVKVDRTGNRQHTRAILFTIAASTYL